MRILAAMAVLVTLQAQAEEPGFSEYWLSNVSRNGPSDAATQEKVLTALSSDDPDVRLAAVRAAGFIKLARATDALTAALDDEVDWRIVWAAAESLARLQATSALPKIQQVALQHWYPPVRDQARIAGEIIRSHTAWSKEPPQDEFFRWEYVGVPSKGKESFIPRLTPGPGEVPVLEAQALVEFFFRSEDGEVLSQVSALRLPEGILVATDNGEWGGELVLRQGGVEFRLLRTNTHALHQTRLGAIALVGLPHGFNRGAIYRIMTDERGGVGARLWRQLPGAPQESGFLPNGDLLIECTGGARVLLTTSGELRLARTSDYPEPPGLAQTHCRHEEWHDGGMAIDGKITEDPLFRLALSSFARLDSCVVSWKEKNGPWLPTVDYFFRSGALRLSRDAEGRVTERLDWWHDITTDAARAALRKRAGQEVDWKRPPTEERDMDGTVRKTWTGRSGRFNYSVSRRESPPSVGIVAEDVTIAPTANAPP
jgi:hypothetical protein